MSNKKRIIKAISLVLGVILIAGLIVAYILYQKIYATNISNHLQKPHYLYIDDKANFADIVDSLNTANLLVDIESFK